VNALNNGDHRDVAFGLICYHQVFHLNKTSLSFSQKKKKEMHETTVGSTNKDS
jgi:hypothetical protein